MCFTETYSVRYGAPLNGVVAILVTLIICQFL